MIASAARQIPKIDSSCLKAAFPQRGQTVVGEVETDIGEAKLVANRFCDRSVTATDIYVHAETRPLVAQQPDHVAVDAEQRVLTFVDFGHALLPTDESMAGIAAIDELGDPMLGINRHRQPTLFFAKIKGAGGVQKVFVVRSSKRVKILIDEIRADLVRKQQTCLCRIVAFSAAADPATVFVQPLVVEDHSGALVHDLIAG